MDDWKSQPEPALSTHNKESLFSEQVGHVHLHDSLGKRGVTKTKTQKRRPKT